MEARGKDNSIIKIGDVTNMLDIPTSYVITMKGTSSAARRPPSSMRMRTSWASGLAGQTSETGRQGSSEAALSSPSLNGLF